MGPVFPYTVASFDGRRHHVVGEFRTLTVAEAVARRALEGRAQLAVVHNDAGRLVFAVDGQGSWQEGGDALPPPVQ